MKGKIKAMLHERSNYLLMNPALLGNLLQRQIIPSRSPVPRWQDWHWSYYTAALGLS